MPVVDNTAGGVGNGAVGETVGAAAGEATAVTASRGALANGLRLADAAPAGEIPNTPLAVKRRRHSRATIDPAESHGLDDIGCQARMSGNKKAVDPQRSGRGLFTFFPNSEICLCQGWSRVDHSTVFVGIVILSKMA